MRVKLSEVPISVRRMAAQHLESLRGSGLAPNVDELYLGDLVCPIYRPDLAQVAYYEFEVLKATPTLPEIRPDLLPGVIKLNLGDAGYLKNYRSDSFPVELLDKELQVRASRPLQGFIMVATGEHDHPIPHWGLEGLPPSYLVETKAATAKTKAVRKIFRMDALCYVGEDEKENQLAVLGQLPSLIKGLPEKLDGYAGKISSVVQTPGAAGAADTTRMKAAVSRKSGAKPLALEFTSATNWAGMKKSFTTNFAPLLRQLQTRVASGPWAVEKAAREMGEGILAGKPHTLALLSSKFSLEVSGEGARQVKVRVLKRPGNGAAVELLCPTLPKGQELSFTVTVTYEDQTKEVLPFFVYSRDIPSSHKSNLTEN